MSSTSDPSTDAEDADRIEQVEYLAKQLKIPKHEADRLLGNMEGGR